MKIRALAAALAAATTLGLLAPATPAAAAEGRPGPLGTRSLATVLAADGNRFDARPGDFDVLDRAVRTVLGAKPGSPVALLADGSVRLTAFLPSDRAFRRLVEDLTGRHVRSERRVFGIVARTVDVDTLEAVLLYHVVPGTRITKRQARQADGARIPTALEGAALRVNVRRAGVFLRDLDRDDANAEITAYGVNYHNRQLGHRIDRVLRPADL